MKATKKSTYSREELEHATSVEQINRINRINAEIEELKEREGMLKEQQRYLVEIERLRNELSTVLKNYRNFKEATNNISALGGASMELI